MALPISSPARNPEHFTNAALPIIAFGIIVAILYFGRVFFITALIAIIIAFILDPFGGLLVRVRFPRALGALVVCGLAAFFLYIAALGAYSQVASLIETMPSLSERLGDRPSCRNSAALDIQAIGDSPGDNQIAPRQLIA